MPGLRTGALELGLEFSSVISCLFYLFNLFVPWFPISKMGMINIHTCVDEMSDIHKP